MRTLFSNSFLCFCMYFHPQNTGNVFPLVRRLAVQRGLSLVDTCIDADHANAATTCGDGPLAGPCCRGCSFNSPGTTDMSYTCESEGCPTGYHAEGDERQIPDPRNPDSTTGRCNSPPASQATDWSAYQNYKCCPDVDFGTTIGDVLSVVKDAFRATRLCGSNACRTLFSTTFTLVDGLVNAQTGVVGCDQATAQTCFSTACFTPMMSGVALSAAPAACTPCYAPAASSIVQIEPMSLIPTSAKFIDRSIFWLTCFVNTDCPAPGVAAQVVTTSFAVEGTVDTFDRLAFKTGLINLLAPPNSTNEGTITPNDITLTVTAGSLNVEAAISTVSPTITTAVSDTITTLTPAAATTALGISVSALTPPIVVDDLFAPPTPPPPPDTPPPPLTPPGVVASPPPPSTPPGIDAPSPPPTGGIDMAMIAGAVGGGGGALLLIIIIIACCCCCKKRPLPPLRTPSAVAKGVDSGGVVLQDGSSTRV